ncbi:hypothetical protein F-S17_0493 [Faustovirus]|nr:hypothetical protein F-S17_0493 [Faustovirus]QJX74269.1 hypothetical protein F-E9_516 [Faustovirus]
MQDIIDNYLIKLRPIEFLYANKHICKHVLDYLCGLKIPITHANHFYIIRLLGESGRYSQIAEFTNRNYTNEEDVKTAIREGIMREVDFKYHRYYTDKNYVKEIFLHHAVRFPYRINMNQVIEYIEEKYTTDPEYSLLMKGSMESQIFFDGSTLINDQHYRENWSEYYARQGIIYAIKTSPESLIDMVAYIVDGLYNDADAVIIGDENGDTINCQLIWRCSSLRYTQLFIEEMAGILDDVRMRKLHTLLWHHKTFDIMHELREEMYGKSRHNTPLFNRLRQQNNTRKAIIIRYHISRYTITDYNNYRHYLWFNAGIDYAE